MDKQVFKCECGYTTHFEKALTAHCKFRHHHPFVEAVPDEQKPKTVTKKNTTRKPRAKKTAVKE